MLNEMIFGFVFIQAINKSGCIVAEAEYKHKQPCLLSNVSRTSGSVLRMDCTGLNLTSVPACGKLPVSCDLIRELILKNNQIRKLTPGRLGEYTNMEQLDLSGNPIKIIENGSFQGLTNLLELHLTNIHPDPATVHFENRAFSPMISIKTIDLSNSSIHITSLLSTFCHLGKSIEELTLNYIHSDHAILSLNKRFTECLYKVNLKKLSLNTNWIGSLTLAGLLNLRKLEYVSLRENSIVVDRRVLALVPAVHNLTYLDASCQYHYGCLDVYPWADFLPGVPRLYQDNPISNATVKPLNRSTISLSLLPKLHTLKLSYVLFEINLFSFCWANNHIVNIDMSYSKQIWTAGVFDCLAYLKFLNLRHVSSFIFDPEFFHGMPSLEVLMLGSAGIKQGTFSNSAASKILEKNINLKFLDLSDLGFTNLPSQFLCHQHRLEILILSHNKFRTVRNLHVNFTSIQHLDLSNNLMFDIPVSIINQMEEGIYKKGVKKSLNMTNNPFICVCSSILQIHKVLYSQVNVADAEENGRLTCVLLDKRIVSFPEAFKILKNQCQKLDKVSIVFLTFVYPVALFILLTCCCVYRYRWSIQYVWYKTVKLFQVKEVDQQDNRFIFDAFVAHSQQDEEFVRLQLLRKLESGKEAYSCCVHDRNFLPGEFISDSIVSAINLSKKTILIVTKRFVRSGWCDFESRAAQCHHLGKTRGGIIAIVFPGGYDAAKRKPGLCAILDCVTFLPWPENEEEQNVFWLKLRMALGKPIVPVKKQCACIRNINLPTNGKFVV